MSEVEKQESQKTVVAFITGLLIGGLLVWVFSSTPEKNMVDEKNEKSGEVTKTEEKKQGEISTASTEKKMATGEGSINVDDQPSGVRVELGELMFPEKSGWVVVRDYKDGTFGNALGASFYNVDMGIKPTSIELVRATAKNTEYHVSFFTNSGAMDFKNGEDTMVEGISDTFKTTE